MKIKAGAAIVIAVSLLAVPCAFAASVGKGLDVALENKIGGVTYKEDYSNVDSDWNAFYYEGLLSVNYFKENSLIGRIDFGMPLASSSEETWRVSGAKYQTNDMKFWGMESNIELGYAMPVISDKMLAAMLGGYGFSFTRFTRTNFNVLNIITSTAIVDEDYWVHHIDIGGKLVYSVNEKLKVDLKGIFGFVVYNSAHNSVLGDVEGEGGYLVKTETNIDYDIAENWALTLGGFFTLQHLEGDTKGNLTWPDNDLYTYGGNIGLKYTF